MPITTVLITDPQRDRVLGMDEGHFLDFKGRDIQPSKLSRSVSAFANADGGELYIGITNDKRWAGFHNPEAANGHLQLLESLFPLGEDYAYTFLAHDRENGLVLQLTVRKSRAVVRASDKLPYLRRGAQNLPVNTPEALQLLERNKGITSFENEPVPADPSDISNSTTVITFILSEVPTAEPDAWLRKQRLIQNDKPTVAGLVLFSDLPQALLPKRSGLKIYRYKTTHAEGTRDTLVGNPISVEGCAYDLIHEAVAKTQAIINELRTLGPDGPIPVEYPAETLHEVITNAVLHRDYSIADDVHIRIFDNRVEVESPGRLPAHITPQNILAERFAHNGNIVRVINKFPDPPNKDVGEGLNTAFAAMKRLRLKEPLIEERDNSVVVHIRHEKLASAEDIVLDYLRTNPAITNPDGRQLAGIESENAMKNVFYRLRDRGLLERVPDLGGNKAAWRLTRKGKTHIEKTGAKGV